MPDHPRWVRKFFSDADLEVIVEAVASAERGTSGEIRVHLEPRVRGAARGAAPDALRRARDIFAQLGMHRTAERNGVLIYVALDDHRLAIVGDEGIHVRVGADYWERLRDLLVDRFRAHAPREGMLATIADVGDVLRRFFPRGPDDQNELSNRVSLD
jgi:uncharacterized membrane protein